ncbi:N-acetylglucosamine-6-phosphate deacetylase [Solibacillus silvestris]|uniref:N-acetylglucosamine-6-phosphate deacetylase n=1 Tax=Solibacillus silvestris TaxID=76853 RepID=UPI003F7D23CB
MGKTWYIGPVQVVKEKSIEENHYLVIQSEKIAAICTEDQLPKDGSLFRTKPTDKAMPGMIDQHIHGMAGADVMDGTVESLNTISKVLAPYGVTSFLATTMTAAVHSLQQVIRTIVHSRHLMEGAKIAGVHVEGPFINPIQKGAQSDEFIIKPSVEEFETIAKASENTVKLVTVAAELDEQQALLKYLKANNIVASIGHSDAKYDEAKMLIGKRLIQNATHFCNGMRAIHHREPGLQIALLQSGCMLEIIADGHHIHPAMIQYIYEVIGDERMILISDSMRATDLKDGYYDLGGQQVQVENGLCKLAGEHTLAGSTLNLNEARKNIKRWLQLSDVSLAKMTATNSAKLLGIYETKGSIEEGKDADFYIADEQDEVLLTVIEGEIIYKRSEYSTMQIPEDK